MEITKSSLSTTKKIVLSGILISLATVLGTFSIPVLGAKASPVQHFINVVAGITLGPIYGVGCAFISAVLRNILGTGSILAFPGSMIGVFCAGILYKKYQKSELAVIGEVIGTGIIVSFSSFCTWKGSSYVRIYSSFFIKLYCGKCYCLYCFEV